METELNATHEIKWIRLQEISEAILSEQTGEQLIVNLMLSTEVPMEVRSLVKRADSQVYIMFNPFHNKGLGSLIISLAHELAHIILDTEDHPETLGAKRDELSKLITSWYLRLEKDNQRRVSKKGEKKDEHLQG